jgi:formylglycine-generating enzyme required for sulfatase activity
MVLIPAGSFMMGSTDGESDEKPVHEVSVDAFYMDTYEVTVAQYQRFLNATSRSQPNSWNEQLQFPNRPVVYVSWEDANACANWAGKKLPTEAQWEYAARGGFTGVEGKAMYKYPWGNNADATKANFDSDDSRWWRWGFFKHFMKDVGSYSPNGYGLCDMAGNVCEWCADWYAANYYQKSPKQNPSGPSTGTYRVLRGGSWLDIPDGLRCAIRDWVEPTYCEVHVGFRCVLDVR